jgi:hypothetical protein
MFSANVFHELQPMVGFSCADAVTVHNAATSAAAALRLIWLAKRCLIVLFPSVKRLFCDNVNKIFHKGKKKIT